MHKGYASVCEREKERESEREIEREGERQLACAEMPELICRDILLYCDHMLERSRSGLSLRADLGSAQVQGKS